MENYDRNKGITEGQPNHGHEYSSNMGRIWGGLLIVLFGALLLARKSGADIPHWIFSFETILILFGIYLGIRQSFRTFFWLIPVAIGSILLVDDLYPDFNFDKYTWPLIIIGFGLFLMLKPSKKNADGTRNPRDCGFLEESADDIIDSTVIFGGSKKHIISKNFKGGEVVTVFGGTELNLMQADLAGPVVLELVQVFGGTRLLVPPHWKVQSKDMVAILGGIDDKRPIQPGNTNASTEHILILKGTCVLGGIDIRSY